MPNREDPFVTPHLDDDRCADLVLGLVPAGERDRAVEHARDCRECEGRLRAAAGAHARSLADWNARADAERRTVLPFPRRTARLWPVIAAAAGLVLVVTLPLLRGAARPPLRAERLAPPGEMIETRDGEAVDPRFTAGLEAYAAGDLARARRELAAARTSAGAERMRRLYLAQAEALLGHPDEAVALLEDLDWPFVPEPWRHDGVALFARALRASGSPARADSIVRALRASGPEAPFAP